MSSKAILGDEANPNDGPGRSPLTPFSRPNPALQMATELAKQDFVEARKTSVFAPRPDQEATRLKQQIKLLKSSRSSIAEELARWQRLAERLYEENERLRGLLGERAAGEAKNPGAP